MGGNAGIRGYIIQTIICVLDALESDNKWLSVTLEPLEESEKVDIKWEYPEELIKVTQVKSSQNLIRYPAAKKWCEELELHSPDASSYELLLIGPTENKLSKREDIGKVKIGEFRPLNTDSLIDQASTKIDMYYERNNKSKISSKVREIIVKTLTMHFGTSSIVGRKILKSDFDNELLEWIRVIENQNEKNPFLSLSPPIENQDIPFNHRIAKKLLELVGWTQFGENNKVEIFNEKTLENDEHLINFVGDFEDKLKENSGDFIMVSSIHDLMYPNTSKIEIAKYLNSTEIVFTDFKIKNKAPLKQYDKTDNYSILVWLSTENSEVANDFIQHVKENYKRNLLNDDIYYFLIDNNKANFLISSISTAKNFRDDVPVKFLYPITEANQSPGKIGQRGLKLPVQYINSSIIPIIKEDKTKISFLLFCSDPFSSEALKKLICLTIRLSSGFGNEYLLYFPDYDAIKHKNEALEIIRSFNEELLDEKIMILQYNRVEAAALDSLTSIQVTINKNETFLEIGDQKSLINSKHLNEAFINILPFGDILKPFLNTEGITANDLKIFLAKKGIFVKEANKDKIINLMTSLLFSPKELEDFKSFIDIKDRTVHTTNEIFYIKRNDSLENVIKKIRPNYDNLTDGLNTKIVTPDIEFVKNPTNNNEFTLNIITELKDPTSQISVNTEWGKVEIILTKENNNIVTKQINTISREDKIIANRLVKSLVVELQRVEFIKEESIKVTFKNFKSNTERVNFLLSFSDVPLSPIFKEADIRSIKFKFDDNLAAIPELYKDKVDKDLVINFSGKKLISLNELSDPQSKEAISLEEMTITYKFDYLNIKNGYFTVKFNFSDALKSKGEMDGIFKSETFLYMSKQIKELKDIDSFKKVLSKEIEKIKLEKLKQFNIIE